MLSKSFKRFGEIPRAGGVTSALLTLRDLRDAGARLVVECLRCGHVAYRPASTIEGPGNLVIGAIGLELSCADCGAEACITSWDQQGSDT